MIKPPLQSLLLHGEKGWDSVLSGKQTVSIREGEREYRLGFVTICCPDLNRCIGADITEVRYCEARDVKPEEYRADDYSSIGEMLADLKRYYPSISEKSPVTVIRWAGIRGKLVEEYRRAHRSNIQ